MPLAPVKAPWPQSVAHAINAAALGILFLGSLAVFDRLPERIPTHFGFDGSPDGWSNRSLLAWLSMPLIAVAVAAITYGAAWVVARFPNAMNLPDRKRYEALPLAGKFRIIAVVQRTLFWTSAGITLTMLGYHAGAFQVAVGASPILPLWARAMLVALVAGSPFGAVFVIVRTHRIMIGLSPNLPPS